MKLLERRTGLLRHLTIRALDRAIVSGFRPFQVAVLREQSAEVERAIGVAAVVGAPVGG